MNGNAEGLSTRKLDWCVSGALGVLAAVVYGATVSAAAFPGEGARLMAVWAGLDTSAFSAYPVFSFFARLFGGGNVLAPVSGVFAVVALYHVAAFFVRERILKDTAADDAAPVLGAIGGGVTAALFLFTPCVWSAYTHLEPRGFAVAWLLAGALFFVPLARGGAAVAWCSAAAVGAFAGLGLLDMPHAFYLFPLELVFVWATFRRRGDSPYAPTAICVFAFILAFFVPLAAAVGDTMAFASAHKELVLLTVRPRGWFLVLLFATVPFLAVIVSSGLGFNGRGGAMSWIFHGALSFVAVLAYATPFSPSSLMRPYGILPVTAALFTAWLCGSLAVYWYVHGRIVTANAGDSEDGRRFARIGRGLSTVMGSVLAAVLLLTVVLEAASFDRGRGDFADEIARRIIADMGSRTWIVTDGALDDHLRLAARRAQKDLKLVCLQRDTDTKYIGALTEEVEASGLGGEKNHDLVLSLSLGVLPFLQDWLAYDPAGAATNVVIFGAPDLWYGAGLKAVPETLFFGADPARLPNGSRWDEFEPLLRAPKGWGSHRLQACEDPIERRRLNLRRHFGFVANNRAIYLQDQKRDDEAFDLYDLVLDEVDPDNVSALFNEYEMANAGHPRAAAKMRALTARLGAIVEDKGRRYELLPLGIYYGYVRSPMVFIRMGLAWASRGRPGEALSQIRRAIDFIPSDNRDSVLNMMAALYANDAKPRESREIYEEVLGRDTTNHDALIGLMRLALGEGDVKRAIECLERAVVAAGDDPRAQTEVAMLHLLKGELVEARTVLRALTDRDRDNMQAWSLLSAVVMQQIDAAKDEREAKALMKELKDEILVTMGKVADSMNDYNYKTAQAFVLLREGGEENLRQARDAFVAATQDRPDVASTGDLVLGLDIRLDDKEHAERAAREVLRRNRRAPLANYVMGSLALGRGDYESAEAFLRRSADADRPVALAMNDLAEVLRRKGLFVEAERYARKAVATEPALYVAWETLGSILLDAKGSLDEAETCVKKACDLSRDKDGKEADVRMLISLARVQSARGENQRARGTLRKVQGRLDELTEFERGEFENLKKSVR